MSALKIVALVGGVLVVGVAGLYAWTRIDPHEVRAEVEIDAPADAVWATLTDLDAYPEWNPFIVESVGVPTAGETLTNTLSNHGSTMTFTPRVLVADEARELRWIGRFGIPGIVDGEHYFLIEAVDDDTTRLVQGETFTGALVPFAGRALDVEDGFRAMNEALRDRVEARS